MIGVHRLQASITRLLAPSVQSRTVLAAALFCRLQRVGTTPEMYGVKSEKLTL